MSISTESPKKISKLFYASNGLFQFPLTFYGIGLGLFLMYYYETIIGLNAFYIALALTIFAFWDAINDPLLGFLTDRNFKMTRKWGRRFPWIVISIVPWCLSGYLIYSVPSNWNGTDNTWLVFLWLVGSYCILDVFGTLIGISVTALRPDLFRTNEERRIASGYFGLFDMIAQALAMIVPPLLLGSGNGRSPYAFMALMLGIITFIVILFCLPGNRENKTIIDRYYLPEQEKGVGFFQGLRFVATQKSFWIFIITLCMFNMATNLMTNNVPYLTEFVLRTGSDTMTIIFAVFLTGALISIIPWLYYLKKSRNNKKVMVIGGILFSLALIPMNFFQGLIDLLIIVFILGMCMGAMWIYFYILTLGDVVDEFVAKTKINQKGILIGAVFIVTKVIQTLDELIIAIVHNFTDFLPGYPTYAEMAAVVPNMDLVIFGIRLISGIIPAIIMLIGTFIFWKWFPLTQDKIDANKKILEKLGL